MGRYYGVRAIMRRGRRIENIERLDLLRCRPEPPYQPYIKEDEALIGIVSNALYLTAPDLTSAYEYEAFRKAYAQGHFVAIILYKIRKSDLVNCPDEGRVDIDEFKDSQELYGELLGIRH
jgi:hypothetical protein